MHYRNKRPLPIYNKPNEQIVRTNVPAADNIQMTSTGSRGIDGPIDDEVIYSKPSFENNSSSQTRNYELSDRRPKSFQSATSSTSKPDDNWEPEADRQAKQNLNAQPVRASSQDYLKRPMLFTKTKILEAPFILNTGMSFKVQVYRDKVALLAHIQGKKKIHWSDINSNIYVYYFSCACKAIVSLN